MPTEGKRDSFLDDSLGKVLAQTEGDVRVQSSCFGAGRVFHDTVEVVVVQCVVEGDVYRVFFLNHRVHVVQVRDKVVRQQLTISALN